MAFDGPDKFNIDWRSPIQYEICVSCGAETNVPKSWHIDLRKYYVEGAGQLCDDCGKKLNNKRYDKIKFKTN